MDSREDRIREKAHALWEADGRPDGMDRAHWERAAQIVDEEEHRAAQEAADPTHAPAAPGITGPFEADNPIGVMLSPTRRRK